MFVGYRLLNLKGYNMGEIEEKSKKNRMLFIPVAENSLVIAFNTRAQYDESALFDFTCNYFDNAQSYVGLD